MAVAPGRTTLLASAASVGALLLLAACGPGGSGTSAREGASESAGSASADPAPGSLAAEPENVTLAFAGDVHFEGGLASLLDDPDATLGPMSQRLTEADVAMVNLESALGRQGSPASKELEIPSARYWFRSPPAALGLLERSGVDAVSIANNHGADYGPVGLQASLRIARNSPVAVVGAGADAAAAYTPHRVDVRGTSVALFGADDSPRESSDPVWAAGEDGLGLASARGAGGDQLVAAVRRAASTDDIVAVYVHWGREGDATETEQQKRLAQRLARAGADVVVGAHSHVLQGAGMLGETYVSYGLGNFVWYNGSRSETGVLQLELTPDGDVVGDTWSPARIPSAGGTPRVVDGPEATAAVTQWRRLRQGSGLQVPPGRDAPELPEYAAQVQQLDDGLREQMVGSSHREGCPVSLDDLRLVTVSYVGFDGDSRTGQMIVAAEVADQVTTIFGRLYRARFPIRDMQLVDAFGGDDNASMAANNSSAYNCRRVAGSDSWSDHAYGRAIDLNPVQNPYLTGGSVLPPRGRPFADLPRSAASQTPAGAIVRDGVVHRAFTEAGWSWGGDFSEPDYQHFSAPAR